MIRKLFHRASELAGSWKDAEAFMTAVDKVTIDDLNAAFRKIFEQYQLDVPW